MKKTIIGLVASLLVATAMAQEPTRIAKSEVEVMVVGKKVWYLRSRDNSKIAWDFKADGTVYYATPNSRRNVLVPGTYTIDDRGRVCFKWGEVKDFVMQDGCVGFQRDGEKLHVIGGGDPPRVLGEVLPE